MTTEDAFLQEIVANPDHDAPRLIYADWLEDHGGSERAEFIRLQCELATLSEYDSRQGDLRLREQELLAAHETEWVGALPEEVRGWRSDEASSKRSKSQ